MNEIIPLFDFKEINKETHLTNSQIILDINGKQYKGEHKKFGAHLATIF